MKYWKNREARLQQSRSYRKENLEICKHAQKRYWQNLRLEALTKIAESHGSFMIYCMKCGFSDKRALQIDHINGGGTEELRREYGHNTLGYYKHILVLTKESVRSQYQILCANCNMIKKEENRENYIWKLSVAKTQFAEIKQ